MRPTKRDSVLVAAGAVVSGAGGFLFTWVVARATGPGGAGVVLTVTTWFTLLLTLGKFGMDTTLVREGGRLRAGGSGADGRRLLRWTLWPVVAVSAAVGVAVCLGADYIGPWVLADSPVPLTPLVIGVGFMLPLGVYTVVQLAFVRGLGSMTSYVVIEQLLKPGLRFLAACALLAAGAVGAIAYGWAWLLPVALGAVLTAVAMSRIHLPAAGPGDPAERRRIWRYSGPRAASQAVDIANTSIGTIALGVLSTPAETGSFATALRIVFAGQLAFQAVRLLVAPSFAALLADGRRDDAQEVFDSGTALIVLLAWPLFLLCLIAPTAVLSLFGPGFAEAAPALRVLALSGLVLAVVGNQGSVVLMSGRSGAALVAVSAGLAANVVITLGLLSEWGSVAAAAGWTAAVVTEGLLLARALRSAGFRPLPGPALAMAGRVSACCVPGFAAAALLWPGSPAAGLAVIVIALAATAAWSLPASRREFHRLTTGETHG